MKFLCRKEMTSLGNATCNTCKKRIYSFTNKETMELPIKACSQAIWFSYSKSNKNKFIPKDTDFLDCKKNQKVAKVFYNSSFEKPRDPFTRGTISLQKQTILFKFQAIPSFLISKALLSATIKTLQRQHLSENNIQLSSVSKDECKKLPFGGIDIPHDPYLPIRSKPCHKKTTLLIKVALGATIEEREFHHYQTELILLTILGFSPGIKFVPSSLKTRDKIMHYSTTDIQKSGSKVVVTDAQYFNPGQSLNRFLDLVSIFNKTQTIKNINQLLTLSKSLKKAQKLKKGFMNNWLNISLPFLSVSSIKSLIALFSCQDLLLIT